MSAEQGGGIQQAVCRIVICQPKGRGIRVVERSDAPGNTGTFLIVWKHGDRSKARIQASNGLFEQIFNSTSQICIFVKIGKFMI